MSEETHTPTIRRVIGFDYGHRRIGVASGETITGSSTPVTTLSQIDGNPDWKGIALQIERWQPDALVVGVPLLLDGGESNMTMACRHFIHCLKKRHDLPIYEIDERLSSEEAERRLRDKGRKIHQQNKNEVDKIAAALIVQSWLDQR